MEEAGRVLEMGLVATGDDGETAAQPAPTRSGPQGEPRKPQRPPYHKDGVPPRTRTRVLPNTCTRTHVPLLAPGPGGKRQKTPVTLRADPMCVCHLRASSSASRRIRAKHFGTCWGSWGTKGRLGRSAEPVCVTVSAPRLLRSSAKRQARERGR